MKVLIIADCISEQRAGIHFYAKSWVKKLLEVNPKNEYYSISTKSLELPINQQVIIPINRFVPFHYRLRYFIEMPLAINKIKPDLIITLAHFWPFFLNKNHRKWTLIYDLTPLTHSDYHRWGNVLAHKLLLRQIITRSDKVITISNTTKNEILKLFRIDRKKIIVNYPQLSKYSMSENEVENRIVTIGTIEPRKDQVTIIKAYVSIFQAISDYHLDIIGQKGWRNKMFWRYLDSLGEEVQEKIDIPGYLSNEDLKSKLSSARIFVFASITEGFGLPILEAMSYGKPLILSDTPIHREVAGDAALYFEVGDFAELGSILLRTINNKDLLESLKLHSLERFKEFSKRPLNIPIIN